MTKKSILVIILTILLFIMTLSCQENNEKKEPAKLVKENNTDNNKVEKILNDIEIPTINMQDIKKFQNMGKDFQKKITGITEKYLGKLKNIDTSNLQNEIRAITSKYTENINVDIASLQNEIDALTKKYTEEVENIDSDALTKAIQSIVDEYMIEINKYVPNN